jgi:hypothetical protein
MGRKLHRRYICSYLHIHLLVNHVSLLLSVASISISINPHLSALDSSYLTLPYLTLPYLTLPYLTLPYLTLPYLTLPPVLALVPH